MLERDLCIVIPAVKKNVAFPDDLIKKLNGVPLIHWAIQKGKEIVSPNDVCVITDSQEISLICERKCVNYEYQKDLKLSTRNILRDLKPFLSGKRKYYRFFLILYPYVPLLPVETIQKAYQTVTQGNYDALITVKNGQYRRFNISNNHIDQLIYGDAPNTIQTEAKALLFLKSELLAKKKNQIKLYPFVLSEEIIEIRNYQDWWVCEKLLRRKRIVFRIIGYPKVGMGHIYRSLAIAHEITDHEIIFVCNRKSTLAVNKIAGSDYLIYAFPENEIVDRVIALQPDLVINDILNTSKRYLKRLKQSSIKTLNFEDLGGGASCADVTINELYDEPVIDGPNIKWGHQYFFLRDEFNDAKPCTFRKRVKNLLVTFGGTDEQNLTLKVLTSLLDECKKREINIFIVAGAGYRHKRKLRKFISNCSYHNIDFTYETGVISRIMEHSDIAVSSNGRTVYELCHMNIPSLIISHHPRETTHLFANNSNGFIHLNCFKEGKTENMLNQYFCRLVDHHQFRKALFMKMKPYSFVHNKSKVVSIIESLLK